VIIGAGLIAAGAVQRGIQSRTMFLEDTQKNFTDMLKEIRETKYTLQL
jgi:flagellin-like hook-associated protein FlgL